MDVVGHEQECWCISFKITCSSDVDFDFEVVERLM